MMFRPDAVAENLLTVVVDGVPLAVRSGDVVATALGLHGVFRLRASPRAGAPRGAFCFMGACQDVRDHDRRRAAAGLPDGGAGGNGDRAQRRAVSVAIERRDLIVLGAGPAGANAAIAAAEAGLSVMLLDEQRQAGGQVWRAPLSGVAPRSSPEAVAGAALRARLARSAVDVRFDRRVWSVGGRFRVDALSATSEGGPLAVEAPRLIAACGAHERVTPFPGWTLPGVIGLAAATVLLKSHDIAPGRRVVVAGCGPLLMAVAAGLLKAGAEVAAIVDVAARASWLAALPHLATQPRLLATGLGWALKVAGRRVPILFGHAVRRAEGGDQVEAVVIAPVDADGAFTAGSERRIAVDALCVGHGLTPGAEVTRLLRAAHGFDRRRGGFVPRTDAFGLTSVDGLYAVGDGAGLRGARIAEATGRLAGLAAAHAAGRLSGGAFRAASGPLLGDVAKATPFSDAMADMMALRPAQVAAIPPETVVCRCEDVTRAEIDGAFQAGARDVNQMKQFTRCGMGPCQGRMCGDVAAELLAVHVGSREAAGVFTGRPPLRPVGFADLMGDFDYAEIPIPEPAPL